MSCRFGFTCIFLILFNTTLLLAQDKVAPAKPEIYALLRSSKINLLLDKVMQVQAVDGISCYIGLALLQPDAADQFNGSQLDRIFEACKNHDKKITLVLIGGRWIPKWVYDAGAKPVDWQHKTIRVNPGSRKQVAPLPWDQVYLNAMAHAVQALANRYGNHPNLTRVQITGPSLANGLEANFNLSPEHAKEVGFTHERYAGAWLQMAKVFMDAFPKQQLAWAIHNHFPTADGRDTDFASSLRNQLATLVGNRFVVMHCYLTHEKWYESQNTAVKLWRESAPTSKLGAQLIDIYSAKKIAPAKMVQACQKAQAMGSNYVEIFAEDLIIPEYAKAITAMKQLD